MAISMDSSLEEQSIDGVIRQIRALLNDSGGQNMPRVLAAWHIHCVPLERERACAGLITMTRTIAAGHLSINGSNIAPAVTPCPTRAINVTCEQEVEKKDE